MCTFWQILLGLLGGRRRLVLVAVGMFMLTACVCTENAQAQSSSPISPWLMMTQRNRGALSNYQAYVQPQLQQQQMAKTLQSQGAMLQRTQSATRNIEDALGNDENILNAPGQRGGGSRAAAGFRNHAHWYRGISVDPTPRDQRKFR